MMHRAVDWMLLLAALYGLLWPLPQLDVRLVAAALLVDRLFSDWGTDFGPARLRELRRHAEAYSVARMVLEGGVAIVGLGLLITAFKAPAMDWLGAALGLAMIAVGIWRFSPRPSETRV